MSAGRLLRGTRLQLGFTSDEHDLSVTPVTVVADGPPSGTTVTRHVWEWRPGGTSDAEFSWDDAGQQLVFTLLSGWTATGFTVGRWTVHVLAGTPATSQDDVLAYPLTVRDGAGGAMPASA